LMADDTDSGGALEVRWMGGARFIERLVKEVGHGTAR